MERISRHGRYTRRRAAPMRRRRVGYGQAIASSNGFVGATDSTLRERAERFVGLLDRRIVVRRHFPRLSAGMHDKPAVDELVRCVPDHLLLTNIWIGEGALNFPEAYGEELDVLGPLRIGRGYRFSFS